MLRLLTVIVDRLLKGLKRINSLLEDLHHGDPADIFGARLGYPVLCGLVFRHKLRVFAAHHGEHGDNGDHGCQQAGKPHPPVEQEHQDHHCKKQDDSAHDVRQVMGEQSLRVGRGRVKTAPDQPGRIGVKIAEGRLHHMGNALFSDVGGCAECRQMGAHQACKI